MIYGDRVALTPAQEKALDASSSSGHGLVALITASGSRARRREIAAAGRLLSSPPRSSSRPTPSCRDSSRSPRGKSLCRAGRRPADRTVIMERVDAQGRQPWTWVRTQGKGRIFYTAYGHDERTWSNPGFQSSIENAESCGRSTSRRAQRWQQLEDARRRRTSTASTCRTTRTAIPPPKFQLPFTPEEAQKFMQTPAEFELELFASEPRHHQADHVHVRRARPAVGDRGHGLSRTTCSTAIPATTASRSSRTPTATAAPTRSRSSPTISTCRRSLTFANGGVIVAAAPQSCS